MRKNTGEMRAVQAVQAVQAAEQDRAATRRVREALNTQYDQAARKADDVLRRLRECAEEVSGGPKFSLVRIK